MVFSGGLVGKNMVSPMDNPGSINILHVAAVGNENFGVGSAVLGLSKAQRDLGAMVTLWTTDSEQESTEIRLRHSFSPDTFVNFPALGPSRFGYSPAMECAAKKLPARSDWVLHQHGVWPARTGPHFAGSIGKRAHDHCRPWGTSSLPFTPVQA